MNPIEKDLETETTKTARGNATALSSGEHADVAEALDKLEKDNSTLYTLLTARGYKKSASYVRASLENIRKARGSQNFQFLKEKRTRGESPYYGAAKAADDEETEDDDDGAEG